MIELEKTYLAKFLPDGIENCEKKEIIDIYFPESLKHPKIRIRKNGERYEITKKELVNEGDASHQKEQTIILNKIEYDNLIRLGGKKVHKIRYFFNYKEKIAEIDIFQGDLKGLIVIDFEFDEISEKDSFDIPDFCLADITQEEFIAGGIICGKSYENIEEYLEKFNYKKIFLDK